MSEHLNRDPTTSEYLILLAAVAGVAALDYALVRRGRLSLSHVVRRSVPIRVAAWALLIHSTVRIPGDPLTGLAERIAPKS